MSGVAVMERFKRESEMDALSEEELKKFKHWLFKENVRINAERKEIKKIKERLKRENTFFDQKMEILQDGFRKLEIDRQNFEKERRRFLMEKEYYEDNSLLQEAEGEALVHQLFCGVKNQLTLKKRYKDLIKIYHPDNVAGNHEMVLLINKEYEQLKSEFEKKW